VLKTAPGKPFFAAMANRFLKTDQTDIFTAEDTENAEGKTISEKVLKEN
jgi:hypothetical protein